MTNIEIDRDTDKTWIVTVTDIDDAVFDLSAAELYFLLASDYTTAILITKKNTAAGGGDAQIEFVTDGTDGKYKIHLLSTDTPNMTGRYIYYTYCTVGGKTYKIALDYMTVVKTLSLTQG